MCYNRGRGEVNDVSEKDSATLLMVQATLLLHPSKGQAQVTREEWVLLCDGLLKRASSQSLGRLLVDLKRRREEVFPLVELTKGCL